MECRAFDVIMKEFPERRALSKYAAKRLPCEIKGHMQILAGQEIYMDCIFENDDGGYLYANRDDADMFVLVASSGQGDEWLLKLSDNTIWFLDHGEWEEADGIQPLEICFKQFVVMADLLRQFEIKYPSPALKESGELLKIQLRSIKENLVWNYPFACADGWLDDM